MNYYLYCVTEKLSEFDRSTPGILDQLVEIISFDEFDIVVSELGEPTVPVTRENVLRHESVVRKVLVEKTPLPFRFGTIVSKEGIEGFVRGRRPALVERLGKVRDCVELSVKVIWSPVEVEDDISQPDQVEELGAGAAFLAGKRKELLGDQKLIVEAEKISGWLRELFSDVVRNQMVNVQPKEKLVFAGAYLVARERVPEFREKLSQAIAERPDLHFLSSGPWPPYTFANIDLEFKTHFGVS